MDIKNKKAKAWLKEGLISEDQMEAILRYEKSKKPTFSYSLYGFLTVAVVSVSLGLIALIAANWWIIPSFVKLIVYFLSLGGLSFYAIKKDLNPNGLWFSGLLLFFMVFCLAGIGLIAQIYNIKGESYQTLFFWSLLTVGLMLLSQGSMVLYLWFASFYSAIWLFLIEEVLDGQLLFKFLLCQPLLLGFFALFFHNKKVVKAFPSLKFKRQVFEEGALLASLLSLVLFHTISRSSQLNEVDFFLLGPFCGLTVLGIYLSAYKKIQKKLLTGILSLFFLFYVLAFESSFNSLGLMIFSVLFLTLFAFFFATLKKKQIFTFFIFAIIVRILIFYISLFKNLTVTGLILLFSGFFIFAVVKWIKNNEQQWIKWVDSLE